VDTLAIARTKLPGQRHKLDSLCSHYGIDNSARVFHGALLDAQLLAEVYVELMGGLQASFGLEPVGPTRVVQTETTVVMAASAGIVHAPTAEELAAHKAFLESVVPKALWGKDET
jgi:DNA polymerase III subunit epsilon